MACQGENVALPGGWSSQQMLLDDFLCVSCQNSLVFFICPHEGSLWLVFVPMIFLCCFSICHDDDLLFQERWLLPWVLQRGKGLAGTDAEGHCAFVPAPQA